MDTADATFTDDAGIDIFKKWFFPLPLEGWGQGRILITSRSNKYRGETVLGDISRVKLTPMNTDEAELMILKLLYDPEAESELWDAEKEYARVLVGKNYLDGLPIAITAVAGQIRDTTSTIKDYLEAFPPEVSGSLWKERIYEALKRAIEHAIDKGFGRELTIAANAGNPDLIDEAEFDEGSASALRELCKLQLLQRGGKQNVYSMHRLYQQVLREQPNPDADL